VGGILGLFAPGGAGGGGIFLAYAHPNFVTFVTNVVGKARVEWHWLCEPKRFSFPPSELVGYALGEVCAQGVLVKKTVPRLSTEER